MKNLLLEFYAEDGPERVGFVLADGSIVEVVNDAPNPNEGFDVCVEDLATFGDLAVATWHTHPGGTMNLSAQDSEMFLAWPDLRHFIIGNDGVKVYEVNDGKVLNVS